MVKTKNYLEGFIVRNKSIIKSILALVLVVASIFTMVACKKEVVEEKTQELPNIVESKRHYYQQGYLDSWTVVKQGQDGHLFDEATGLLIQLAPAKDGKAVENVQYNVWIHGSEKIGLTTSRNDLIKLITNDTNADFAFNKINVVEEGKERESYAQQGEPSRFTGKYSKLQFDKVEYTYTRDGNDWKGIYYITWANDSKYFVVSYEAEASVFDTYKADAEETIGDFRKEGWETAK